MRRFPTTPLIVIVAIIAVVGGWLIYGKTEMERFHAVDAVRSARSYIKLALHVTYPHGPIAREEYVLVDNNGRSKATYTVFNRKGTAATFDEVLHGLDIPSTFDQLVHDGIWELDSKQPRSLNDVKYTVRIDQTAQGQSGYRRFSFTDPTYWSTAREFHITLDPKKATPSESDLLRMNQTAAPEPRYARIVADFRSFGSPTFKRTVARARSKLLKS